jgi:putative colanic acid biosynthesis acetyltransferase WcaF
MTPVQDLSKFRNPPGFRGRSAVYVQIWWLVQATLFRLSPQFLYGWRRFLLRAFGASIGEGVLVRPTVRIVYPWKLTIGDHAWIGDHADLYCLGEIEIGRNAVVSQQAYLCTGSHDMRSEAFDIFARPIKVEEEAWIATRVFVHPGVTVARGSVVGACAVLNADTEPFGVYAGQPARKVSERLKPRR